MPYSVVAAGEDRIPSYPCHSCSGTCSNLSILSTCPTQLSPGPMGQVGGDAQGRFSQFPGGGGAPELNTKASPAPPPATHTSQDQLTGPKAVHSSTARSRLCSDPEPPHPMDVSGEGTFSKLGQVLHVEMCPQLRKCEATDHVGIAFPQRLALQSLPQRASAADAFPQDVPRAVSSRVSPLQCGSAALIRRSLP